MSLLRVFASLREPPLRCCWALLSAGHAPRSGEGTLAQLPQRAERVQLVLPAADVLIACVQLAHSAGRLGAAALAYAMEEQTAGEPDTNQVSWLGRITDAGAGVKVNVDALAVVNRSALDAWRDALGGVGIRSFEIHCESLMLPWAAGEWSVAWNGRDGFVRSGEFAGMATDCGDRQTPPLSLRLMLDEARARNDAPRAIVLHAVPAEEAAEVGPDLDAWQRELGVPVRRGANWDWRTASSAAGVSISQQRPRWGSVPAVLARLRPAALIVAIALLIHTLALLADWSLLAGEQRGLRRQMDARFRAAFPDAVAVVDPALQMRRKLADARHTAGQSDSGDFLPMMEKIALALKDVAPGTLRVASYESGRMTLELNMLDEALVRRIVARLLEAGMLVDSSASGARGAKTAVLITVRSS